MNRLRGERDEGPFDEALEERVSAVERKVRVLEAFRSAQTAFDRRTSQVPHSPERRGA